MFFHDHMRGRGTSLNFADLASDPPPANLQVDTTTHAFHTCAHQHYCQAAPQQKHWGCTADHFLRAHLVRGWTLHARGAESTLLRAGGVSADVRGVAGGHPVREGHRNAPGALPLAHAHERTVIYMKPQSRCHGQDDSRTPSELAENPQADKPSMWLRQPM